MIITGTALFGTSNCVAFLKKTAGVQVDRREWQGTAHEFFGANAVIADAADAQRWAGERLRGAFGGQAVPAGAVSPGAEPQAPKPVSSPEADRAGERG